jgi:uncharacterized protein YdeI (YjbR/CyaY-like superfamily)
MSGNLNNSPFYILHMTQQFEQLILTFATQQAWEKWLTKNHGSIDGVWLKFYKKSSGITGLTYEEALDEALCYGWIDGQAKSLDEKAYLQKFTPRRKRSMWSKRNTEHIARLTKLGKMKPSGILEVERAKKDGRWENAYESSSNMIVPEEFLRELKKHKKAYAFFQTLNKTNTYAIAWQLHNAKKEETKRSRAEKFIAMLARGEKIH